jgi:hypothetical protein
VDQKHFLNIPPETENRAEAASNQAEIHNSAM